MEKVSRALAVPNQFSGDLQALEQEVKSMMERSQNMVPSGKQVDGTPRQTTAFICKVCGKEGHPTGIKRHIERHHLEGISIPCDVCGKFFSTRQSLREHKANVHN